MHRRPSHNHDQYSKTAASTLLLFCTLSTAPALGQVVNSFGLQFGLSRANQTWHYKSFNNTHEMGYRNGLYGAATIDFLNTRYFHITTELGYCEKGFAEKIDTFSAEGSTGHYVIESNVNYLFLNNAVKLKYQAGGFIPFVQLGIRVDRQWSYDTFFLDAKEFRPWIYGLTAAAGFEYKISRVGIFGMLQYLYDLRKMMDTSPVYDIAGNQLSVGMDIRNRAYVANLGVRYYLSHKVQSPESQQTN